MPNKNLIVFDLDGTLIDSASSILTSIRTAFEDIGIQPKHSLSNDLIGPPLAETILYLLGDDQIDSLPRVIEAFKYHYDEIGYQETFVYPGVQNMLEQMHMNSIKLYIATNKRIHPTQKILNYLGWERFFEGIYSLDAYTPNLQGKSEMLQRIYSGDPAKFRNMIYVGDRAEDAEAAIANNLSFVWASWGYCKHIAGMSNYQTANSPKEVLDAIAEL